MGKEQGISPSLKGSCNWCFCGVNFFVYVRLQWSLCKIWLGQSLVIDHVSGHIFTISPPLWPFKVSGIDRTIHKYLLERWKVNNYRHWEIYEGEEKNESEPMLDLKTIISAALRFWIVLSDQMWQPLTWANLLWFPGRDNINQNLSF